MKKNYITKFYIHKYQTALKRKTLKNHIITKIMMTAQIYHYLFHIFIATNINFSHQIDIHSKIVIYKIHSSN